MKQTSWKILAVLPADLGQRGKAERNSQTTSHPAPHLNVLCRCSRGLGGGGGAGGGLSLA